MKTADITGLRRLDTLEVGGDLFRVDRITQDDGDAVISACNGVTVPGVISVRGDIMKGLENAIRNLDILDTRMVPQASAWAINRVAQKAISQATRQVARDTVAGDNQMKGIPLKLVRGRVRMLSASPSGKMYARSALTVATFPPSN